MDYFSRLPIEIQENILAYELVVPYRRVYTGQTKIHSQGICIIDGRVEFPYTTALFKVNRSISHLARSICYSKNRFILGGDFSTTLAWLKSQPKEFLLIVTRLDLLILPEQILSWDQRLGWHELVQGIPRYFDLNSLCLSIDACRIYPEIDKYKDDEKCFEHEFDWLNPVYKQLMLPFQDNSTNLQPLKDIFVFYPKHWQEEGELERTVKGEQYDSILRGKRILHERDWKLIHGWEWPDKNEKGLGDRDHMDWDYESMDDVGICDWKGGYNEEFREEAFFRYYGCSASLKSLYKERNIVRREV